MRSAAVAGVRAGRARRRRTAHRIRQRLGDDVVRQPRDDVRPRRERRAARRRQLLDVAGEHRIAIVPLRRVDRGAVGRVDPTAIDEHRRVRSGEPNRRQQVDARRSLLAFASRRSARARSRASPATRTRRKRAGRRIARQRSRIDRGRIEARHDERVPRAPLRRAGATARSRVARRPRPRRPRTRRTARASRGSTDVHVEQCR